jgi:hypothetical protein
MARKRDAEKKVCYRCNEQDSPKPLYPPAILNHSIGEMLIVDGFQSVSLSDISCLLLPTQSGVRIVQYVCASSGVVVMLTVTLMVVFLEEFERCLEGVYNLRGAGIDVVWPKLYLRAGNFAL